MQTEAVISTSVRGEISKLQISHPPTGGFEMTEKMKFKFLEKQQI